MTYWGRRDDVERKRGRIDSVRDAPADVADTLLSMAHQVSICSREMEVTRPWLQLDLKPGPMASASVVGT